MTKENPQLEKFDLPPFDRIKAEHIKPAIDELINNNKKSIEDLINNTQSKIDSVDEDKLLTQLENIKTYKSDIVKLNNDLKFFYQLRFRRLRLDVHQIS